jgi:hypothetical protein
MYESNDP